MKWTPKVVSTLELVIRLRQLPALKILFSSGKSTSTNCGDMMLLQLHSWCPGYSFNYDRWEIWRLYGSNLDRSIVRNTRKRVRWLGQIGVYIYHAKVRYGFISTYNETIFLKQEQNPSSGVFGLWYSPVIQRFSKHSHSQPIIVVMSHWESAWCTCYLKSEQTIGNRITIYLWIIFILIERNSEVSLNPTGPDFYMQRIYYTL